MTYGQAKAQGITYKAWLHMCEQEEIEREQEEREEEERDKQYGGYWPTWPADCLDVTATVPVPDSLTVTYEEIEREQAEEHTPERMSQVTDHEVELARAVLHCPEPIPEESALVEAAINSPIARWIKGQLAMERRVG